jgi:hypothetical protein
VEVSWRKKHSLLGNRKLVCLSLNFQFCFQEEEEEEEVGFFFWGTWVVCFLIK